MSDQQPRTCLFCGETISTTLVGLEDHMIALHGQKRGSFPCPSKDCFRMFPTAQRRNQHERACLKRDTRRVRPYYDVKVEDTV